MVVSVCPSPMGMTHYLDVLPAVYVKARLAGGRVTHWATNAGYYLPLMCAVR